MKLPVFKAKSIQTNLPRKSIIIRQQQQAPKISFPELASCSIAP